MNWEINKVLKDQNKIRIKTYLMLSNLANLQIFRLQLTLNNIKKLRQFPQLRIIRMNVINDKIYKKIKIK